MLNKAAGIRDPVGLDAMEDDEMLSYIGLAFVLNKTELQHWENRLFGMDRYIISVGERSECC